MFEKFMGPVEDLSGSTKEYLDLRLTDLKLKTTKGLAISLSQVLSMILILFVALIVFLALAFGLILLIGDAIGSYAGGAFIVAGVFAILTIILYLNRDKMFVNKFVKLFIGIFFDDENSKEGE